LRVFAGEDLADFADVDFVALAGGDLAGVADVDLAGFAGVDFVAVAVVAAADAVCVAAATGVPVRRVPMRSGRVDGSAASTPFSSFFGFAFAFFDFSALSAMPLRVYGSRSGRGARPPSFRHKSTIRRAVLLKWGAFAYLHD
jgi:hypothetical protein